MTLVKFGCGCIGTQPAENGDFLLVQECGNENGQLTCRQRNVHQNIGVQHQTGKPISSVDAAEIWQKIETLIGRGYRLTEMAQSLRHVVEQKL